MKKCKKKVKKQIAKVIQKFAQTNTFKQKYFEFYDDIKDYTKGKEDW